MKTKKNQKLASGAKTRQQGKTIAPETYPSTDVQQLDNWLNDLENWGTDTEKNLEDIWNSLTSWKGILPLEPKIDERGKSSGAGTGDNLLDLQQIPDTPPGDVHGESDIERLVKTVGAIDDTAHRQKTKQRATIETIIQRVQRAKMEYAAAVTQRNRDRERFADVFERPPSTSEELEGLLEGFAEQQYSPSSWRGTKKRENLWGLFGTTPTEKIIDRIPTREQTCEETEKFLRAQGLAINLCPSRRQVDISGEI